MFVLGIAGDQRILTWMTIWPESRRFDSIGRRITQGIERAQLNSSGIAA
jgi:hypothetical protein